MSLPYFNMYPADFEADTSHLTLEEDGAYNRLLRLMWMTPGCSLPNDDAWIARRMRCDAATFERVVKPLISEFLTIENGRVFSPRLSREAMLSEQAHQRRVEAGSKGGRKPNPLKNNDTEQSNAKAMPKQPEPEPEPYIKIEAKASVVPACDVSEAVNYYNETAVRAGWSQVIKMDSARRKSLQCRIRDCDGIDGWREAMNRAASSDFLCGRRPGAKGPFFASFDFLTKSQNFTKLMEGNYDNRSSRGAPASSALDEIAAAARAR